ncbi:DUF1289 domain-containing protein [Thalassotalea ponticola]|uniref:DUF1289 domain-containing protein n=1 Tax=Thalassotalea ponticola TaxID=1523392 RepID=UPI0025B5F97C|nr:DUF1289 domain-containing protein [Thalassotalea ponticola]MDN3653642.1 DUF1289 domain-containing protein [Thalassotalea ponticola]
MKDLQLDFFDVPSPCIGVCKVDARGYCQGCYRTRQERFGWLEFSNNEKQRIIKLCKQREKRRNAPPKEKSSQINDQEVAAKQPSLLDIKPEQLICTSVDDDDFTDFEL